MHLHRAVSQLFHEAKIVAVVGDDFAQEDFDLLAVAGIDLHGLERVPGKTFFWAGVYSHDMNDRETLRTDLNVFADFNPKLPESTGARPICCWAISSPRCSAQSERR